MKKFLLSTAFLALVYSSCTKEGSVIINLSQNTADELTLIHSVKEIQIVISNGSNIPATITWNHAITLMGPATWTYKINNSLTNGGSFELDAGQSTTLTLSINPQGINGLASGQFEFFAASDKDATLKTFTYSLHAVNTYFHTSPIGALSGTNSANNSSNYDIWITNPNDAPITLTWLRTNEGNKPAGWDFRVSSYLPNTLTESIYLGAAGSSDSSQFRFSVSPNNMPGQGSSTLLFYIPSDSSNSVVSHVIHHTAN